MKKFYVTYGTNHEDSKGISLGMCFTEIFACNEGEARDIIYKARGDKWAFCYREEEKPTAIDRWNLSHKTLNSVSL